ncbi:MAG: 4-hydroxythreonine-4-phosphate dehydrogenase PdxA [Kiritimatiellae bacterium]|nr:4-hydroxythreonine-4-phosphate dehydrogenase PdxA [Kiritimatiellia bacterium]
MKGLPRPSIGITMGDPAGVGPELVLRALHDPEVRATVHPVIYGSRSLLRRVAAAASLPWPQGLRTVAAGAARPAAKATVPWLYDTPVSEPIEPGRAQASCGRLAAGWIEAAVCDALAGRLAAVVTAPICKAALHAAGINYPGHTEMLAALTGRKEVGMFFWSPRLAVGLATIHIALEDVAPRLTLELVLATIRRVAAAMRSAALPSPRIGVLALNPHAGEDGLFGDTEARVIAPAIAAARSEGIAATGPLVPDTAFRREALARFDAFVAMYHDQGLIPFKLLAFEEGVNVTLGLPIIRTSPDHGTAFDIAWQGQASPASLIAAIRRARDMAAAKLETGN